MGRSPKKRPAKQSGAEQKSSPAADIKFTPTEKRILDLLSDGYPHTRKEIHGCLWDDLSRLSTIQKHISTLRGKIRPLGQEIVCEIYMSKIHYRHVIILNSKTN